MKARFFHTGLIFYLSLALSVSSCLTAEDCETDSIAQVSINFRQNTEAMLQDTVEFDSVKIIGLPDTIFYKISDTLTGPFFLPLDPANNLMEVLFFDHDTVPGTETLFFERDTLKLRYDVVPELLGEDCGVILTYRNLEVELVRGLANGADRAAVRDHRIEKEIDTYNVDIFR